MLKDVWFEMTPSTTGLYILGHLLSHIAIHFYITYLYTLIFNKLIPKHGTLVKNHPVCINPTSNGNFSTFLVQMSPKNFTFPINLWGCLNAYHILSSPWNGKKRSFYNIFVVSGDKFQIYFYPPTLPMQKNWVKMVPK